MTSAVFSRHFSGVPVRHLPTRPLGISALAVFFALGALISLTASGTLFFPGGMLDSIWRLNPRARVAFGNMGMWAPLLLATLSLACGTAGIGLWEGWRWGYRLAVGLLSVQFAGDLANVLLETEPRAALGLPVVAALLWFLSKKSVRGFFRIV